MEYDYPYSCNKCGGKNNVEQKDETNYMMSEAATECEVCEHKDYWAYGFFESEYGKSKKYNPNKIELIHDSGT